MQKKRIRNYKWKKNLKKAVSFSLNDNAPDWCIANCTTPPGSSLGSISTTAVEFECNTVSPEVAVNTKWNSSVISGISSSAIWTVYTVDRSPALMVIFCEDTLKSPDEADCGIAVIDTTTSSLKVLFFK